MARTAIACKQQTLAANWLPASSVRGDKWMRGVANRWYGLWLFIADNGA